MYKFLREIDFSITNNYKKKYPNQNIFIILIKIKEYVYIVPYVEDDNAKEKSFKRFYTLPEYYSDINRSVCNKQDKIKC